MWVHYVHFYLMELYQHFLFQILERTEADRHSEGGMAESFRERKHLWHPLFRLRRLGEW